MVRGKMPDIRNGIIILNSTISSITEIKSKNMLTNFTGVFSANFNEILLISDCNNCSMSVIAESENNAAYKRKKLLKAAPKH